MDTVTILDAENMYGQMTLSNATALGSRDVLISTGDEGVYLTDAFEVIGGDWNLEEVAIDLSFYVSRSKDNDTEISEAVQANCTFYIRWTSLPFWWWRLRFRIGKFGVSDSVRQQPGVWRDG